MWYTQACAPERPETLDFCAIDKYHDAQECPSASLRSTHDSSVELDRPIVVAFSVTGISVSRQLEKKSKKFEIGNAECFYILQKFLQWKTGLIHTHPTLILYSSNATLRHQYSNLLLRP
jgi:hypothetical protein